MIGDICTIIFSKNRAMQLDCCIRSLLVYGYGMHPYKINVIYNVDSDEHRKSYDILKKRYSYINFVESFNFQETVYSLCSNAQYTFFIVDDCIFTNVFEVDIIKKSLKKNTDAVGFSLRLGRNTKYCYPVDKIQSIGACENLEDDIIKFNWVGSEYDFGYPLEVSSSIFRTDDIVSFLKNVDYHNPNQLESILDRYKSTFKISHPYLLCYKSSKGFCNPINKISKLNVNRSGEKKRYSTDSLLKLFIKGFTVNITGLRGFVSNSPHQEVDLDFERIEE